MTNKIHITLVLVALLLISSVVMWAQGSITVTPGPATTVQGSDTTGSHIDSGCFFCHTPHSTGTIQQPGTARSLSATAANNATGLAVASEQPEGVGLNNAGSVYLWAYAITPVAYTTWDGSAGLLQYNNSGVLATSQTPAVHSLLCLTCHDSADLAHGPGGFKALGGTTTVGTNTEPGFGPGSGIASTYYVGTSATGNIGGWAATSGLLTDHPIHAYYPVNSTDNHYGMYWGVTIQGSGASAVVSFNDGAFVPWAGGSAFPGHPARLYTDGTHAYVECTTCHEAHRQSHVAYQVNGTSMTTYGGTWVVDQNNTSATATTSNYLRGPWITASTASTSVSGLEDAGFCRTCHYDKTSDYINNLGVVGLANP